MKNNWMPISGKLPIRDEKGQFGYESKVIQVKLKNNFETEGIYLGGTIGWKVFIPEEDVFRYAKHLDESLKVTHWRYENG